MRMKVNMMMKVHAMMRTARDSGNGAKSQPRRVNGRGKLTFCDVFKCENDVMEAEFLDEDCERLQSATERKHNHDHDIMNGCHDHDRQVERDSLE